MTSEVCLTVDVEDWYEGMAVLGSSVARPREAASGLGGLVRCLDDGTTAGSLTLFVVGNYAESVREELGVLASRGHEIASHGPDHGRLPDRPRELLDWLRRGLAGLEDLFQAPVRGFRSPRFDVPAGIGLAGYRDLLAEAGFEYVSDTSTLGSRSPVRELPVLARGRLPIGGGSYQRLFPAAVTTAAVDAAIDASAATGTATNTATGATGTVEGRPVVLYYHSYDFGATLPDVVSIRSLAVAKQLVGRGRVSKVFSRVLSRYGSQACGRAGR